MISSLLIALLLQTAPASGLQRLPPPCSGAEFRQFDFWIGGWDVRTPAGAPAGTNRIEAIEGGCGLQESWSSPGSTGRSINAYSRSDGRWHQFWLGSGGLVLHLTGGLRDGKMILEGQTTAKGQVTRHRITWTSMPDGNVRQLWEQSSDEGKSWTVAFDGLYLTKKRAA